MIRLFLALRRLMSLCVVMFALGCGSDDGSPPTLTRYEGGLEPERSGWGVFSDPFANRIPGTVTVQTQVGENGKALRVATDGGAVHLYFLPTGVRTFALAVRVNVIRNASNAYDFGFGIAPFVADPTHDFAALDRAVSLVPLADRLVWADLNEGAVPFVSAGIHEYALRYDGATLSAYVDVPFASVIDGSATAVLSRAVSGPTGTARNGFIGFGDMTNEADVNSDYEMYSVQFVEIAPER